MNHLTLSSVEMSDVEVEKAVDKIGRTARRTVDTHIRNVLSKPRVATTMRRMTAMFNFSPDLPSISSIDEKPDLRVEPTVAQKRVEKPSPKEHLEVERGVTPKHIERSSQASNSGDQVKRMEPDSTTESDADEPVNRKMVNKLLSSFAGPSKQDETKMDDSPTPAPAAQVKTEPSSDSDSSPRRSNKRPKPKISSSSDDDSQAASKPRIATTSLGGTRRGAAPRQPIKRGGKRF